MKVSKLEDQIELLNAKLAGQLDADEIEALEKELLEANLKLEQAIAA